MALPGNGLERISGYVSLLSRLLRTGAHHLIVSDVSALVIADRNSYISIENDLRILSPLQGSRPLVLCESEGTFYYGEYRSNPERSAVHIWRWRPGTPGWSPVWRFEGIRHVHGVFHDPYSGAIWVTTGDEDSEAGIWRTDDDFESLHRVAGDGQQSRAVQLLFTRDYVYFGSDTPNEQNHIYRMDRQGHHVDRLAAVGGSVFYGCKAGESLFLSTAVEPSEVNTRPYAEVWRSDNGDDWYRFLEFKKDILPMKYFQYGQVFFPAGPGDGRHLYCTPFATRGHGKTVVIDVEESKGQFLGDVFK
ncbi:MAG: hypothetical protein SVT56_05095 [Chloroflexota bacterium]|nr:hypothetical protein [Chloroflexota bacterium]